MNERQREQVGRIIDLCTNTSRAELSNALNSVQTEFVLAGRSGSGMEMTSFVHRASQEGGSLISDLVNKIAAVSKTPDAFEEIESAVRRWLQASQDQVLDLHRMSRSVRLQGDRGSIAIEVGRREFKQASETIEKRLAVEKFDFQQSDTSPGTPVLAVKTNKGGRPSAEFWDDMWAEIAASLYDGGLQPKSQADVERAMTTWIEGEGFSAAVSTVRARARRLWDRIDSSSE